MPELSKAVPKIGVANLLGDVDLWILWLGLQVPSLRALYKYLPLHLHFLIYAYLGVTLVAYAALLHSGWLNQRLQKILSSGWLTVFLLAVVFGVNYFVYPVADALKYQMRGTDQDDALIQLGRRLGHLVSPYAEKTYFGNPISTGPGLVLLLWPLLSSERYFLITPLGLAGIAFMIYRARGSFYPANLFIGLCLSSLGFWETMVAGSDLFIIGGLFVLGLALIFYKIEANIFYMILGILLLALAATSRIIFIYLVPLVSLFLWKRRPSLGLTFLIFALPTALLTHAIFYFWDPANYTPLHLIAKGGQLLPLVLKGGLVICGLIVAWFTFTKLTDTFSSWMLFLWLGLITPLAFVSCGDLYVYRNFDFALWEGANYLMVPLPALLVYIVLKRFGAERASPAGAR